MIIYYFRHGDPIYNPDSLTEYGKQQAEQLKNKLKDIHFDRIYSSTSNRAYLTSLPTALDHGLKPVQLAWADENHLWNFFSVTEGKDTKWASQSKTYGPIFASPEISSLGDTWYNHPAFVNTRFREGILEFQKEQDHFFEELGYRHDRKNHYFTEIRKNDETIAFFAHGGCGNCFLSSLLDLPLPFFASHFVQHSTCGMSIIAMKQKNDFFVPEIWKFNESL